jgi:hypothetical protein
MFYSKYHSFLEVFIAKKKSQANIREKKPEISLSSNQYQSTAAALSRKSYRYQFLATDQS